MNTDLQLTVRKNLTLEDIRSEVNKIKEETSEGNTKYKSRMPFSVFDGNATLDLILEMYLDENSGNIWFDLYWATTLEEYNGSWCVDLGQILRSMIDEEIVISEEHYG